LYGDYAIKESEYAGDGYADGIFKDPETLNYPRYPDTHNKTIGIVELYGKNYQL